MSDQRMQYAVEVSLSMLKQWYVTWEHYGNSRHADLRRGALKAKCMGLVFHDRELCKCQEVIGG